MSKELLVISSNDKLTQILECNLDNPCYSAALDGAEPAKFVLHSVATERDGLNRLSQRFGEINLASIQDTVVFVDLMLDDCDGLSLVEKLRNNYHQLPIVAFMSEQGAAQAPLEALQLRSQAEECGADTVLLAPLNLREVLASIMRLLQCPQSSNVLQETQSAATHSVAV